MIQTCKFCKSRDRGRVIKGLAPDLNDLVNNHKIPDSAADVVYNELHNVDDVGFRINDDFDAIVVSRALKAQGLTPNSGTGSSQPAGSTAPVSSNSNSGASSASE